MANPDHLAIAKSGVAAIQAFQSDDKTDDLLDLSGADLGGANLREANLLGADLTGANLTKADLQQAHLDMSRLNGTNLTGANLRHADLFMADLIRANLTEANLSRTQLFATDLTGARSPFLKRVGRITVIRQRYPDRPGCVECSLIRSPLNKSRSQKSNRSITFRRRIEQHDRLDRLR